MTMYKARHALVSWTDEDGTPRTMFRGQKGDIPDKEAARLKKFDAIVSVDEELQRPGVLQDLPLAPDDEELVAWLAGANATEIAEMATKRPELRPRIEGALEGIRQLRDGEDAHLEEARRALSPDAVKREGATGGIEEIEGGDDPTKMNTPVHVGDDAFVEVDPAGQFLGGGPDGSTLNADTTRETNTPLSDTPAPMTTDINTLVQGSVDEVAAYIGEHPDEADAVLAAEAAAHDGQPRVGVVLAQRSATEFKQ
jgi:hypothetical protein